MESDESLQELTGVGVAPASDTPSTSGLAPRKGNSRELRPGVDPCQGSFLSSPPHARVQVRTYVRTFLEDQSRKFEPRKFMLTSRVDIPRKFIPPKISRYTVTPLHLFHYIVGGVVATWLALCCCSESAMVACRCPATVRTHFHIKGG